MVPIYINILQWGQSIVVEVVQWFWVFTPLINMYIFSMPQALLLYIIGPFDVSYFPSPYCVVSYFQGKFEPKSLIFHIYWLFMSPFPVLECTNGFFFTLTSWFLFCIKWWGMPKFPPFDWSLPMTPNHYLGNKSRNLDSTLELVDINGRFPFDW